MPCVFSVREGEQGEPEMRRMVRYPDAHQLFVGNVPHDVDKSELKEFFERKCAATHSEVENHADSCNVGELEPISLSPPPHVEYGTVLELRINSGGKLPNFGFVVFDDSEPVQKILSNRVRPLT